MGSQKGLFGVVVEAERAPGSGRRGDLDMKSWLPGQGGGVGIEALPRELAEAWAEGFNAAERERPAGVRGRVQAMIWEQGE